MVMTKYIGIVSFIMFGVLFSGCASNERVDKLRDQNEQLSQKLDGLGDRIDALEKGQLLLNKDVQNIIANQNMLIKLFTSLPKAAQSEITEIKTVDTIQIRNDEFVAGRCQAKTKKGTQCTRTASKGSKYCWQHGGKSNVSSEGTAVDTSKEGTFVGPRGGVYHYSKSGNKVYSKKK